MYASWWYHRENFYCPKNPLCSLHSPSPPNSGSFFFWWWHSSPLLRCIETSIATQSWEANPFHILCVVSAVIKWSGLLLTLVLACLIMKITHVFSSTMWHLPRETFDLAIDSLKHRGWLQSSIYIFNFPWEFLFYLQIKVCCSVSRCLTLALLSFFFFTQFEIFLVLDIMSDLFVDSWTF